MELTHSHTSQAYLTVLSINCDESDICLMLFKSKHYKHKTCIMRWIHSRWLHVCHQQKVVLIIDSTGDELYVIHAELSALLYGK